MGGTQGGYGDDCVIRRTDGPLSAAVDDEVVLLEPDSGTYYGMNEVGSLLWEALETPTTVAELRSRLVEEFDIEADRAQEDLADFLDHLEDTGLVEARQLDDAP